MSLFVLVKGKIGILITVIMLENRMNLYQLLKESYIKVPLESNTKEGVLRELVDLLCDSHSISDREDVYNKIKDRESAMSTGIGNNVAVPHCKCSCVDRLVAFLGISKEGIDFDSLDEKPAKIFFILVAEENNPGPHIKALAKLSRLLSSNSLREELLNAKDAAEVLSTIKTREQAL
jgi:nitrogen PTS system EIIA component